MSLRAATLARLVSEATAREPSLEEVGFKARREVVARKFEAIAKLKKHGLGPDGQPVKAVAS